MVLQNIRPAVVLVVLCPCLTGLVRAELVGRGDLLMPQVQQSRNSSGLLHNRPEFNHSIPGQRKLEKALSAVIVARKKDPIQCSVSVLL